MCSYYLLQVFVITMSLFHDIRLSFVYIKERIEPGFAGSSSVRFWLMFRNSIRARFGSISFLEKLFGFGSTSFLEKQFEFGSVRLHLWKSGSSSVRFDFVFNNQVQIWFESSSASSTKSEINN
jgi:hypothetical protein